jgi:hypothetical protein
MVTVTGSSEEARGGAARRQAPDPFPPRVCFLRRKGTSVPLETNGFRRVDSAVIATGLVSFLALFLPWWGVSFGGFSATVSGWHTSYGWVGGVLVVLGALWYALAAAGVGIPRLAASAAMGAAGVTVVGLVIVLIRWLTLPRGGYLGRDFTYGGRAGIWIAVIAAVVQVLALLRVSRRSGETLPWRSPGGRGPV